MYTPHEITGWKLRIVRDEAQVLENPWQVDAYLPLPTEDLKRRGFFPQAFTCWVENYATYAEATALVSTILATPIDLLPMVSDIREGAIYRP